jgi:site-specific recombinase XerD
MRSTFKVLFFLKRDKQKSNGMIPLFCRITVDGQEVRFGMKCDINPKFWDLKSGRAIGRTAESVKINALADNTKAAIFKIYRELQEGNSYITAEKVKNIFLGVEIKQQTLLELFDIYSKELKTAAGTNFSHNHYFYSRTRELLSDFLRRWYSVSDIAVRETESRFIHDFEAYLTANYRFSHNTTAKHLKNLKHIMNVAVDRDFTGKNPFAKFNRQYKNPGREILTNEEVETLMTFQFDDKELEQTRDIFIFCCFTGLSYTDVFNMNANNLQPAFDGKMWIKGRRRKTDVEYSIPLLNIPKMILEKYGNSRQDNQLLPVTYLVRYNLLLKKTAKICGIEKNLSSHIARHTFATTITLTKGVPIETVSKMLGHTSIQTTQIYAKVINSKISSDMALLAEKLGGMETKMAVNF